MIEELKRKWLKELECYRNEAEEYFLDKITYAELKIRRKRSERKEMQARHDYLKHCKKQGRY